MSRVYKISLTRILDMNYLLELSMYMYIFTELEVNNDGGLQWSGYWYFGCNTPKITQSTQSIDQSVSAEMPANYGIVGWK